MAKIVAIIGWAFVGGATRYWLSVTLPIVAGFPWATIIVNLVGSGLLAWLSHAETLTAKWPNALTVGLGVGGLGAFTTFSTFGLDTVRLLDQQSWGLAGLYIAVSLIGGLVMSGLGVGCARRWWHFPVAEV